MIKQTKIVIAILILIYFVDYINAGTISFDNTVPAITESADGKYIFLSSNDATTTGVNFQCTTTTQNGKDVNGYLWKFPGGNPASSTEQNPGTVLYPNAAYAQDNLCTVGVSHAGSSNETCASSSTPVTKIHVVIPGFYFDNESVNVDGSFYVPSGWTLQNGVIPVASDVTASMLTSGIEMGSIDATDNHQGNWTLDPGTGSTDGSGNFQTTIRTKESTTLQDSQSKAYVLLEIGNMTIKSNDEKIYPAIFNDKFRLTVYFTTKESGYPSTPARSCPVYTQDGKTLIGSYTFATSFLIDVDMEGYGRMKTQILGSYYLGSEPKNTNTGKPQYYHIDTAAKDPKGNVLHPTIGESMGTAHSCAYQPGYYKLFSEISVTNNSIINAYGTSKFVIQDTGQKISDPLHIDLYYADDEPLYPGSDRPLHCTYPGCNRNQYTETVILNHQ